MYKSWIPAMLLSAMLWPACASAQQAGTEAAAPDPVAEKRADLAAAEAAHPGNTPEVVDALMALVQRQRIVRQITPETDELAQRALTVSAAAAGKDSILYAQALASMAKLTVSEDHPETGRPLAEQALEIARRAAPATLDLAQVADALGKVCWELRDTPCALHAAEEALTAIRASHTEDELYLASMLQDLAQIKLNIGDAAGARTAILESVAIVERQSKPAPTMAVLESNAGVFFNQQNQPEEALLHLNKSLALATSLYGPDSIQVGYASHALGDLYARTGRGRESAALFEKTLGLFQKWYGPTHTRTADVERSYAWMSAAFGTLRQALDLSLHAQKTNREYIGMSVRVMPERQALTLAEKMAFPLDVSLSIVAKHPEVGTADVYQEEIRSRALVAEEMAKRQASLNRNNDPEIAALLKELDKERAAVVASIGSTKTGASVQQEYNDATVRMERTERALAERSLAFRADQRNRTVALDDVRKHLPRNSVLISYVAFHRVPIATGRQVPGAVPSYLAFVLHPDSERIRIFDLGDARPIDDLVSRSRAAAEAEAHAGGMGSKRNERLYRVSGEALRKLVWDPLRPQLVNAKLALVVADGQLNLIPFSGLPDGNGYLVEHGPVIHMLTSERDLVPAEDTARKTGLLAIGSPQFDLAEVNLPSSPLRGATIPCDEFGKQEFHSLPGSANEVTDIGLTWRRWNRDEASSLLTGADATRARFLTDAERFRVLHVATHAFLLDKSCGNGNPLLHSGLVFAGANQSRDSSILTAQQIASLDLNGVDWAVLSACNTGNGELHDGEGVMGLERAFRVAGAHSVIMTLWPVDDQVTRRFMHELYAQRLGHRATTADAVWNASRKLLLERRAAGKSTHPWYWAGYVGSGGWE